MRIRIEFQGPGFVAVPNHVAARVGVDLSPDALAVLVRAALLPVGSSWDVSTLRRLTGLGDFRWRKAAAELRAMGALFDDEEAATGDDGKRRGRVLSIRWPDAPKASASGRNVGKPKRGKPTVVGVGKPKRGKPTFRQAQVIENEGESRGEVCEKPALPKTKTDGDAAAPLALAAASPSGAEPLSESEGESGAERASEVERDIERQAYLERVAARGWKRAPVRPNAFDAVQNGGKVGDAERLESEMQAMRLRRCGVEVDAMNDQSVKR